jgi:uncharacterized LabA/DUF88 family protein
MSSFNSPHTDSTYALLVDGDNINPARMEEILNDVQERGPLKTFRIYADFSKHTASSWKTVVESHACDAVQVYSSRPQAVDLTMSLDGLECLSNDEPCTLCIASGDRDFTHLMRKAHQRGRKVIAYATNMHVSPQYINCCDEFIHLRPQITTPNKTPNKNAEMLCTAELRVLVREIMESEAQSPVHPTCVVTGLMARNPAYNYENFGHNSFKQWMESLGFLVDDRQICSDGW